MSNTAKWLEKWDTDITPWQENEVNCHLISNWSRLLGSRDPGNMRVFLPLCGKSLDLGWLYDRGCSVVGVEVSIKAVLKVFSEHNISHEIVDQSVGDHKQYLYQTPDHRLRIYACDLFEMEHLGEEKFDLIVDRGSFVAIPSELRTQYLKLITNVLKANGMWLLMTVFYDNTVHTQPAACITDEDLANIIGDRFTSEQVAYGPFKVMPFFEERVTLHSFKQYLD